MSALQRNVIQNCFCKYNLCNKKCRKEILFFDCCHSEVVGSNPVGGGAKNSYCGRSSDNFFWTPHDLKIYAVWSKVDCKAFYVN